MALMYFKNGSNFVNIGQVVYPVGSLYCSTSSTSPATLFGGSWTKVTKGLLAAAGTSGFAANNSQGGSLQISKNQLPNINGAFYIRGFDPQYSNYILYATGDLQRNIQLWAGDHYVAEKVYMTNPYQEYVTINVGNNESYYPLHYSINMWYRTA